MQLQSSLLSVGCSTFAFLLAAAVSAADVVTPQINPPDVISMDLPQDVRDWFFNTDGSCVQCSGGMVGVRSNLPAWTFLLFDTEYGRAERGGSGPSRVSAYAKRRGMKLYNVTGKDSWDYMEWSAKTGRFCAMGAGGSHFQTHYGRDWKDGRWFVCNNHQGELVKSYTWDEFKRLHLASGEWCFVPDEPACPPPPVIVEWWK